MIKEATQQDDKALVSVYAPNIKAIKYVMQKLMDIKEETNSNTVIL